jgi:hypothetical protein
MSVVLQTTGLVASVTLDDLGGRTYVHPITVDLAGAISSEYTYEEVRESFDLGVALDAGYVSIINDGIVVGNSSALKQIQPKQTSTNSGDIVGGVTYNESSIYRTPVLTENTDDLSIPNIQNYSVIVITISKDIDLTGILRNTITEYQNIRVVLGNTNNKKLKLKKKDGDSTPSARFYMEKDVELKDGQWWDFLSHKDLDRWTGQGKIR